MIYAFGEYELDTGRHELRYGGVPRSLEPQVFTVLHYLIEHRDRVVPKQELLDHVWPDTFVSESALYQRLRAARRAVGDSGRTQQVIKTVPKQGYRFSARVEARESSLDAGSDTSAVISESPVVEPMPPDAQATSESSFSHAASASPDGITGAERRQVTVLCGRLSNAELLADQLGFEHLERLRQIWLKLAAAEVETYGSVIQPYGEDGFLAFFGLTVAHEDHPRRAVLSGLAICDRLRNAPATVDLPADMGLDVRLGVHTGLVRVRGSTAVEQTPMPVMGETTDLAIRLQSMAAAESVLASESTLRLLRGEVNSEPFASVRRGDQRDAIMTYRIHGLGRWHPLLRHHGMRTLSRFVGREREMAILQASLSQSMSGQGQVIGMMAEAGMGKSRLLYEFAQRLSDQPFTYVECHCLSYGGATPYLPLLDMVRQLCDVSVTDGPEAMRNKVHDHLTAVGLEVVSSAPYLLQLLGSSDASGGLAGLSPKVRKERTFAAMQQLCLRSSQRQPLVLAVENLHWIDPTSEEWLALLVGQLPSVPLLLLTTYRPGYLPLWMDKSYATQLALARLTLADSRAVMQSVLNTALFPEPVVQAVLVKAAGNPFFLEELSHAVMAGGAHDPALAMPDTVQAVLAARIDRLPAADKAFLQLASVMGREWRFSLLQAIAELTAPVLDERLRRLQETEFVYVRQGDAEQTYAFKHALTRDVAYQSLLQSTRQQYHHRVARVLEAQFPETVATQPELLAYHCTEAGLIEEAIAYWHRAGDHATQHSANQEAINHFNKALDLLAMLPDTPEHTRHALTLYIALAERLEVTKGMGAPEVEYAYSRAHELCQQIGDSLLLDQVLAGLFAVHYTRSALPQARELAERLFSRAQHQNDPFLILTSCRFLGHVLFEAGELESAHAYCARGNALYDLRLHPQQQVYDPGFYDASARCRAYDGAKSLWYLGYVDQALVRVQEALSLFQDLTRPYGLGVTLVWAACIHQQRREVQAARVRAEAAMTLCREHGFAQWLVKGTHLWGWALVMQGQKEAGIAQMCQSLASWRTMGIEMFRPYLLTLLAEAYRKADQIEAGLTVLDEALVHVDQTGQRAYEPELHRLKGELLLRQVEPDEQAVEACFQQALDIARGQSARSLELRAAMSLGRLWQSQGESHRARQLLAEIYNWFSEGFDTVDLQQARGLLQALA